MWIASGIGLAAVRGALVAALVGCSASGRAASAPEPDDGEERGKLSGSARALTEEDWGQLRHSSVEEMIAGRVAGVYVVRLAGGEQSLRIRGVSSPVGNNEPLVVIDGIAVSNRRPGGSFSGLNPHDVERIEVLRDAASLALYGMRAANGVILITTRRTR